MKNFFIVFIFILASGYSYAATNLEFKFENYNGITAENKKENLDLKQEIYRRFPKGSNVNYLVSFLKENGAYSDNENFQNNKLWYRYLSKDIAVKRMWILEIEIDADKNIVSISIESGLVGI